MLDCRQKCADRNVQVPGRVGDGKERRFFRNSLPAPLASSEFTPFGEKVQKMRQRPAYLEAGRVGDFVLPHEAKKRARQFEEFLAAVAPGSHRFEVTLASEHTTSDVLPDGGKEHMQIAN